MRGNPVARHFGKREEPGKRNPEYRCRPYAQRLRLDAYEEDESSRRKGIGDQGKEQNGKTLVRGNGQNARHITILIGQDNEVGEEDRSEQAAHAGGGKWTNRQDRDHSGHEIDLQSRGHEAKRRRTWITPTVALRSGASTFGTQSDADRIADRPACKQLKAKLAELPCACPARPALRPRRGWGIYRVITAQGGPPWDSARSISVWRVTWQRRRAQACLVCLSASP